MSTDCLVSQSISLSLSIQYTFKHPYTVDQYIVPLYLKIPALYIYIIYIHTFYLIFNFQAVDDPLNLTLR